MSASRLLPAHVLHHDEIVAVGRLDFVNRDDVRVIERRGGVRFLDKPATAILVADAVRRQHLDRDLAVEPRIAGAIHLAHPTGADEREDLVRPECRARLEGHASGIRRHYRGVIGQWAPNLRGYRRTTRRSNRFAIDEQRRTARPHHARGTFSRGDLHLQPISLGP